MLTSTAGHKRIGGYPLLQEVRFSPHRATRHKLETLLNGTPQQATHGATSLMFTLLAVARPASMNTTLDIQRAVVIFNGAYSTAVLHRQTTLLEDQTTIFTLGRHLARSPRPPPPSPATAQIWPHSITTATATS